MNRRLKSNVNQLLFNMISIRRIIGKEAAL